MRGLPLGLLALRSCVQIATRIPSADLEGPSDSPAAVAFVTEGPNWSHTCGTQGDFRWRRIGVTTGMRSGHLSWLWSCPPGVWFRLLGAARHHEQERERERERERSFAMLHNKSFSMYGSSGVSFYLVC